MAQDEMQLMRQLVNELNRASNSYYSGLGERMTDYEWDAKFDELKQLEQKTGVALPDSPTQKVSDGESSGQKETHEFPALSLAKTKQPEDVVRWAEGKSIWLSWKLDGITLVVTYDNGKLTKVVTRGNGHIGTNVTRLASAIEGLLPTIKAKGHTVIRGEAVISYADFEQYNMESDDSFANPRNLVAGSFTLKDVEEVKPRRIQWIPFTLVHTDENINLWGKRMDWLEAQGFSPVGHESLGIPTIDRVRAVIDRWTEKVTHRINPFPVDGLVITFDDTAFAAMGSVTGHHATRAGLAFKWQDESAETTLDHIEWSCAASTISPVAVFEPVELEGTTVKRASLCNISECERLGIGGPGTQLSVIKANKIIPKVIKVSKTVGDLDIPHHCPVCGSDTEIITSEHSDTRTLHCTNVACPAKQLKKFARFVSKAGMDIDGVSEQTLAKFINLGWISEYADIYRLQSHIYEMTALEGFGERSVSKLLQSIEKSRNVEARCFLYALTIPQCGVDVCKRLLDTFDLGELIRQARIAERPDIFADIPGIGPEKSASLVQWFQDTTNSEQVDHLLTELNIHQEKIEAGGELCQDLTFVITGDVSHYKNRTELKSYIESQGGHVTGSISKSTDFLINNHINSTSSKNKKAKELGIEIISEDQFLSRFTTGKTDTNNHPEGSLFD